MAGHTIVVQDAQMQKAWTYAVYASYAGMLHKPNILLWVLWQPQLVLTLHVSILMSAAQRHTL
jgi:hypothetical protein